MFISEMIEFNMSLDLLWQVFLVTSMATHENYKHDLIWIPTIKANGHNQVYYLTDFNFETWNRIRTAEDRTCSNADHLSSQILSTNLRQPSIPQAASCWPELWARSRSFPGANEICFFGCNIITVVALEIFNQDWSNEKDIIQSPSIYIFYMHVDLEFWL